jgi:hypothetical protein
VAGAAKMLDHPQHRVGDAVHIGEEGFCDDCNAHTTMVAPTTFGKVASGDTTRKVLVPMPGAHAATLLAILQYAAQQAKGM